MYLPGTASLLEQLDKKVLVVLRDGRHLLGTLRSYDQFSNIVMENTSERHVVNGKYGDIPLGLYIVRGENIVLMGEIDEDREKSQTRLIRVSQSEIIEAERQERLSAPSTRAKRHTLLREKWNFDA